MSIKFDPFKLEGSEFSQIFYEQLPKFIELKSE